MPRACGNPHGTSRSERAFRPQASSGGRGNMCSVLPANPPAQLPEACRKAGRPDLPRPRRSVVESRAMAQLAQASPTAPVPPQNLDAEESVLGAMMLSPGAIGAVSEVLDGERLLPREPRQDLPRGARLYAKGEPVDAITLVDELEERGELEDVGGRVAHPRAGRARPGDRRTPATTRGSSARWRRCAASIRAGSEIARLGLGARRARRDRARRPGRAGRLRPLAGAGRRASSATSRSC